MQEILIRNGRIWNGVKLVPGEVLVREGRIADIGYTLFQTLDTQLLDAAGAAILPGLVDVHVHLREPGYSYKETIADGSRAAARGGFTTLCAMPNLDPVPDSPEHLQAELDIINRDAVVEVLPYAAITRGRNGQELVDYESLAPMVAGFSDDGSGVQDREVMLRAMQGIAKTGKVLAAHCEVDSLLNGGYIHDGEYCRSHGHRGICSESEWREVERDIELARETGCRLHICHVSTKESVELIRRAKAEGLPVTCETAVHYLAFCDDDLQEDGRFKMNPPLRSAEDRDSLLKALADGTIDCIASDHAPHADEEKNRGLEGSAMGVSGIELSLPAVYTYAVLPGHITFKRMMELMAVNPRKIFGIGGGLRRGDRADVTVIDFNRKFKVEPQALISKGKATPFAGRELYGETIATISNGRLAYKL